MSRRGMIVIASEFSTMDFKAVIELVVRQSVGHCTPAVTNSASSCRRNALRSLGKAQLTSRKLFSEIDRRLASGCCARMTTLSGSLTSGSSMRSRAAG